MITSNPHPGRDSFSPAQRIGEFLVTYFRQHPDFYLFSPDETTSNKLDTLYDHTARAWHLPRASFDLPESGSGHIIELLSENTLFACMTGHLISGSPAAMTSYEAFFSIITSQILQHLKFLQQSQSVSWRPAYPSANLLSTSTCWRQDHNGFTHQSPALISTLLALPSNLTNCLFPIDDLAAEAAAIYAFNSQNRVNLLTFNKTPQPRWLTSPAADAQFFHGGASIVDFVPDDQPVDFVPDDQPATSAPAAKPTNSKPSHTSPSDHPDYILTAAGDIVSTEALRALAILRRDLPTKRFRFVNIAALSYNAIGTTDRKLTSAEFNQLFTPDRPIIANFHGYPATLEHILAQYATSSRLHVHGFEDQGSTTTPFEMLSLNHASRYHLALDVARLEHRSDLIQKYQHAITSNRAYAHQHGLDQIK